MVIPNPQILHKHCYQWGYLSSKAIQIKHYMSRNGESVGTNADDRCQRTNKVWKQIRTLAYCTKVILIRGNDTNSVRVCPNDGWTFVSPDWLWGFIFSAFHVCGVQAPLRRPSPVHRRILPHGSTVMAFAQDSQDFNPMVKVTVRTRNPRVLAARDSACSEVTCQL